MRNKKRHLRFIFSHFLFLALLSCQQSDVDGPSALGKESSRKPHQGIRIAIPQNESEKDLKKLEKIISEKISEPVKLSVVKEYKDLLRQLQEKKAQFAILPPLVAVQAEREAKIKFLLKKVYGDSDFYYSALVIRSNSKFKSVRDLKGKKVAFVDPDSSSGYLYPKLMLSEAGLDLSDIESSFSGKHDESVKLLAEGKVDAIAVWADQPEKKTGAWTSDSVPSPESFKVLKYSTPIPNDAIVVLESYYKQEPAKVLKIMEALIYISEEMSILKEIFGVDSLTTATSAHYESVRKLEKLKK